MKGTSTFSNSLIWVGAGISIVEILTGVLIAPLGLADGITAIILGHLIGCVLLYFAGLIGANTKKSAMESVKISFGKKGSILFALLNVTQLIGWTAVMIVSGATSANLLFDFANTKIWSIVLAILIILWIFIGIKKLKIVNIIALSGLFILTLFLSNVIFQSEVAYASTNSISFGTAVELSTIMPLSWLPLISDYTRFAKEGKTATFASVGVYFFISSWMYIIGLGVALYTGTNDVTLVMKNANFGIWGLFIIILSTVTTTFLDAYSAGVSSLSIWNKANEKYLAILFTLIGLGIALFVPNSIYEEFLYMIASVFAPMIAILITDYFILKKDNSNKEASLKNLIIWLIGFIVYRYAMQLDTFLGYTVPTMLFIGILCILVDKFEQWKN